ncbi:putative n6-DNA-methyltransferase [Corchorus olitorius]|uniref:N6-DNA-methyltransferase n=1 Tax=Corchorus olitorius TaxID=93759 RepID=A0A1R3HB44_9ROSI|nr:putative n6-DNA-methyltransferase [Corchorus olitorius]
MCKDMAYSGQLEMLPKIAFVAKQNQDLIEVRKGSWFEPLKDVEGKLAGFLSNPPYIPGGDISGLQSEVGQHEPKLALDGGIAGTNDLLHLIDGAASMLGPGGFFAFEVSVVIT